jgi:hypothetical protein
MRGRALGRRWILAVALAVALGAGGGSAWGAFSATTSNGTNSFSTAASDTTAPTISRAVAAKTSGATPGTIRQGGDYHVYAQVTDDSSGVSSVTADTSSFDSGVTSASMSSIGGPWTVGGQTYNYRSAVLTANTPLNTGSSYPYSITAADVAGNSASPSYSVSIETYESVISSTSGLVSHWRLADGSIAADEFTDSAGTLLQNHTGALGTTWTRKDTDDAVITDENRVRKAAGVDDAVYRSSGVPPSANYLVEADIHVKSILANDGAGVTGRVDTSTAGSTAYLARWSAAQGPSGGWQLIKLVNGAATVLGTFNQALTVGSTYRVGLEMNGSTIRLLVDGVQRVSATDTTLSAAGIGGLVLGASGGSTTSSDTASLHVDNYRITSLTTTAVDGPGPNAGTYTGGVRLNQPGALVGDANRAALFDGGDDAISVADSASLDLGDGPLTLEAWVKRSTTTGDESIFLKGTNAYHFTVKAGRLTLTKQAGADIAQSTTTITDTTTWHHVAATKNGASVKLYIDGADVTGTVTNATLANTADSLTIGGGSTPFAGSLDELGIYNSVLSGATVLDHYNAGRGTG